jgi:hypothetical protein
VRKCHPGRALVSVASARLASLVASFRDVFNDVDSTYAPTPVRMNTSLR